MVQNNNKRTVYKFGDKVMFKGRKAIITGTIREYRIEKRKWVTYAEIILEKPYWLFRSYTFVRFDNLKRGWK